MLTSIAVAPINHVLHGESWACKRLQACAGKVVRIRIPPLIDFTFAIQADGILSMPSNDATVDVSMSVSPGMLPFLLTKNETVYSNIKISGDDAIANELIDIGKNLRWDVAQDLSEIMGDIPAHRVVQAGEALVDWHTKSINNFSEMLAEYWLEEQPMLIKSLSANNFAKQVDRLYEDTKIMEKRINNIINQSLPISGKTDP